MTNIAIFCDGTGYEMGEQLSNIAKLYRVTEQNDHQIALYHAGIGQGVLQDDWLTVPQKIRSLFNQATGHGLYDHVIECYNKIRALYEPGDKLFLVGASRGAYTARVLAGFIGLIGILPKEAFDERVTNAFNTYKSISLTERKEAALRLRHNEGSIDAAIHFVGAFDTVSSYIIPRLGERARYATLPWSAGNPRIGTFCQVMAGDERRANFELQRWDEASAKEESPIASETRAGQDVHEVWCPGTHSDILGGNPEAESGLAKIGLSWMANKMRRAGLQLNQALVDHLILGVSNGGTHSYVGPDSAAPLHETLTGAWPALEIVPKKMTAPENGKPHAFGWYLPLAEHRRMRPGDHALGIYERTKAVTGYRSAILS